MKAADYPIVFGYGEWDGTYYTKDRPHRGNDRPTPGGTPIYIGSTLIGYTGNTGLTSGPHLHTQAGTDRGCQNTIDPTPYEFKPGTVIMTGHASQWGNHIIIEVEPGKRYICYAHLESISVSQGQRIKGVTMVDDNITKWVYLSTLDRDLDSEKQGQTVYDYWRGRPVTELLQQAYRDNELLRYKARHFVEPSITNDAKQKLAQIEAIINGTK